MKSTDFSLYWREQDMRLRRDYAELRRIGRAAGLTLTAHYGPQGMDRLTLSDGVRSVSFEIAPDDFAIGIAKAIHEVQEWNN